MRKQKIAISLSKELLENIDRSVDGKSVRSRSQYIETMIRKGMESQSAQMAVIMLRKEHHSVALSRFKNGTLLSSQADFLSRHGVSEILIVTQKGPQLAELEAYAQRMEHPAKTIVTDKPGNADALKLVRDRMDSNFVVLSGDVYNDFDLKKMMEKHAQKGVMMTMALMSRASPSKYGNVILDGDMVVSFQEKPSSAVSHLVNAGLYVFSPAVFSAMEGCHFLEKELFPKLASMRQLTGYFTMGDYYHAQEASPRP
ncbi:MAG: hypothetical protein HY364_03060 [Candidatus Aenigmarchaeota archaeon]|nr:hypothetical protein [Candidatus Aenigmarchaeota archaeon]